jgi:hypothetical protein
MVRPSFDKTLRRRKPAGRPEGQRKVRKMAVRIIADKFNQVMAWLSGPVLETEAEL